MQHIKHKRQNNNNNNINNNNNNNNNNKAYKPQELKNRNYLLGFLQQ